MRIGPGVFGGTRGKQEKILPFRGELAGALPAWPTV